MKCIIGKKIGMTQMFDPNGKRIPVTLVEAGPCAVTQVKTIKVDGYQAVQLGFDKIVEKRVRKSEAKKPFSTIIEFRCDKQDSEAKVGDIVSLAEFKEGDKVIVAGISKGKGFQGVVRRYGYKGRHSVTHGTKHELRNPGSVGCQGGVRKGKGMAGHMGTDRVSVKNLVIVKLDALNNLMALRGALPGNKGTIIEIRG
jgi:large subunit ribosomal protein L3